MCCPAPSPRLGAGHVGVVYQASQRLKRERGDAALPAVFLKGNYDEAIKWSQKGLNQQPAAAWHLRVLVPALFHAGRTEEAHHAFKKMMEHYPGLTIGKVRSALPFGADMVERIVDGLRQIGLPE